jgi:hypothetical protein
VAVTVKRVGATGGVADSTDAAPTQNDVRTTAGNGSIVLRTTDGGITLDGAVGADGTGHVLIQAQGTAKTIAAHADIASGGGHVSVVASGALTLSATTDVTSLGAGTLDLRAASLTMTHGATLSTGSGNIRVAATGAIALGAISTTGDVSLSGSTITDAFASGTDTVNVTADELRIVTTGTAAGDGAGTGANHLEVNATKLAADVNGTVTGGLYLTESTALQIGTLNAIHVNQVGTDGSTLTATTDAALSQVDSDANLVVVTLAGSIETLAAGGAVTATGNLLLKAGGAAGDITLGANVTSSAGHISLDAGRNLLQQADVAAQTADRTVEAFAVGNITMADGTRTTTVGSASVIRYNASPAGTERPTSPRKRFAGNFVGSGPCPSPRGVILRRPL